MPTKYGYEPKKWNDRGKERWRIRFGTKSTEQLSIYHAKMKLTPSVNKRSYWPSKPVMMFWGWKPLKQPTSTA